MFTLANIATAERGAILRHRTWNLTVFGSPIESYFFHRKQTSLPMTTLVGNTAPDFTTQAVMNSERSSKTIISTPRSRGNTLCFLLPDGFYFVCPTELISLNNRIDAFRKLVVVVGVSVDSHWTHNLGNMDVDKGGIGQIDFTLAADLSHEISQAYGIESHGGDSYYPAGVAMRATFIIDQKGIVRHMTVNDEPLGRDIDEVLRIIEALQFFEENGQVCPAGWNKEKAAFSPSDPTKLADYLSGNGASRLTYSSGFKGRPCNSFSIDRVSATPAVDRETQNSVLPMGSPPTPPSGLPFRKLP